MIISCPFRFFASSTRKNSIKTFVHSLSLILSLSMFSTNILIVEIKIHCAAHRAIDGGPANVQVEIKRDEERKRCEQHKEKECRTLCIRISHVAAAMAPTPLAAAAAVTTVVFFHFNRSHIWQQCRTGSLPTIISETLFFLNMWDIFPIISIQLFSFYSLWALSVAGSFT